MFTKKDCYLPFTLLFITISVISSETIIKVLQNGTEGYDGCYDSYSYSNTKDLNYEETENVFQHNCQC
jgi:hypothetical protein